MEDASPKKGDKRGICSIKRGKFDMRVRGLPAGLATAEHLPPGAEVVPVTWNQIETRLHDRPGTPAARKILIAACIGDPDPPGQ